METFEDSGVRFRYPSSWQFEREETGSGWTVFLQSSGTAFATITLDMEMPSTNVVAEAALSALRDEYPDLEADECIETLAGQPAIGHDIRFFSLDLTNTCWTRSFASGLGTLLVLCQANDLELEQNEPILRAMCASLEVDDE